MRFTESRPAYTLCPECDGRGWELVKVPFMVSYRDACTRCNGDRMVFIPATEVCSYATDESEIDREIRNHERYLDPSGHEEGNPFNG